MSEPSELRDLLQTLIEDTNRTLLSHKAVLETHEQNFAAAFKTATSHRDGIEQLRTAMRELTELVNAESRLLQSMQRVMLKVVNHIGMAPPEDLTSPVGAPN